MGRMTKAALMAAIDDPYIVRIDGSELPHEYVWANWWQRQTGDGDARLCRDIFIRLHD